MPLVVAHLGSIFDTDITRTIEAFKKFFTDEIGISNPIDKDFIAKLDKLITKFNLGRYMADLSESDRSNPCAELLAEELFAADLLAATIEKILQQPSPETNKIPLLVSKFIAKWRDMYCAMIVVNENNLQAAREIVEKSKDLAVPKVAFVLLSVTSSLHIRHLTTKLAEHRVPLLETCLRLFSYLSTNIKEDDLRDPAAQMLDAFIKANPREIIVMMPGTPDAIKNPLYMAKAALKETQIAALAEKYSNLSLAEIKGRLDVLAVRALIQTAKVMARGAAQAHRRSSSNASPRFGEAASLLLRSPSSSSLAAVGATPPSPAAATLDTPSPGGAVVGLPPTPKRSPSPGP